MVDGWMRAQGGEGAVETLSEEEHDRLMAKYA